MIEIKLIKTESGEFLTRQQVIDRLCQYDVYLMMKGIDQLHNDFLAGVKANAGKLPVVVLEDTVAIESGSGAKKSTNYQPVFKISSWVKRPNDLADAPSRGSASEAPAPRSAPPATGSTRAAAPAPRAAAPADDEDFG